MDKKGILSWPNPTAEKICFLTPESQRDPVNDEEDQGFSNSCDKIHPHPEGTEKHTSMIYMHVAAFHKKFQRVPSLYCKCGYVCGEGFNDCCLKSCKVYCIGNLQINNRGYRFFSSFIFDDTQIKEKFSLTGVNNKTLRYHFPLCF